MKKIIKAQTDDTIITFVNKLLEERGVSALGLEAEVLNQMREDLLSRVEDRINATILANLPADKLPELEGLLDQNSLEPVQDFCQKNVANLNELIAQELLMFRSTYLNL